MIFNVNCFPNFTILLLIKIVNPHPKTAVIKPYKLSNRMFENNKLFDVNLMAIKIGKAIKDETKIFFIGNVGLALKISYKTDPNAK